MEVFKSPKKAESKPYDLGLHKLKDEIKNKLEFNNSIIEAYMNRISFMENENESSKDEDKKTKNAIEIAELKHKVYYQDKVFDTWKLRAKQWQDQHEEKTKECNENFDKVLELAKESAKDDIMIRSAILSYSNEDNDQLLKNEFYLWICNVVEQASRKKKK